MSVCFYNTKGWMVGIDIHMFQAAAPPDPLPIPILFHPHIAVVKLSWGICSEKTKLKKVTSDGAPMLQKGHKLKMVPHVFVPCALPHPAEALQIAQVILSSKTTCVMGVASVTGGGEPLATCLHESIGANVDCSSPVDLASGLVHSGNTVRTTPATSDYVNAGIDLALGVLDKAIELLVKKPDGKDPGWMKRYKEIKKKGKIAEQIVKYLLKKIDKTLPMPSDLEKKVTKMREDLIRKLLGGH